MGSGLEMVVPFSLPRKFLTWHLAFYFDFVGSNIAPLAVPYTTTIYSSTHSKYLLPGAN